MLGSVTLVLPIPCHARLDTCCRYEPTHHVPPTSIEAHPAQQLPVPIATWSFLRLPRAITGPGHSPCLYKEPLHRSRSGHATAKNAVMRAPFFDAGCINVDNRPLTHVPPSAVTPSWTASGSRCVATAATPLLQRLRCLSACSLISGASPQHLTHSSSGCGQLRTA